MDRFVIYLIGGYVSVYRLDDGSMVPLRYEGEERFLYSDDFWKWFKKKIDYNNEELSFVVVSDVEFEIPGDIVIAKKSSFDKMPVLREYKNTKIFTFPKIEQTEIKKVLKRDKRKGLVDFFVDKTTNLK